MGIGPVGELFACLGGCGTIGPMSFMCWECVEGARILNRNAMKNLRERLAVYEPEPPPPGSTWERIRKPLL